MLLTTTTGASMETDRKRGSPFPEGKQTQKALGSGSPTKGVSWLELDVPAKRIGSFGLKRPLSRSNLDQRNLEGLQRNDIRPTLEKSTRKKTA